MNLRIYWVVIVMSGGGCMHIQENHGSNINMIPLTQIHLSQDVKCGILTIVCSRGGGVTEGKYIFDYTCSCSSRIYLTMHAQAGCI